MNNQSTPLSAAEQRIREHALRHAAAGLRIEDIPIDPAVHALLAQHARGEVSDQQLDAHMRELTAQ